MRITRRNAIVGGAALGLLPSLAKAAETRTYYFMMFNSPIAGMEKAFNSYYDDVHIYDVTSIPGFVNGQRFIRNEPQMIPGVLPRLPTYLTLWEIRTDDLDAVFAEVMRRIKSGETHYSPTIDKGFSAYVYAVASPKQKRGIPQPADFSGKPQTRYRHIVFTRALAGRDAEWRAWYDAVHSPSMLRMPGVVTAERLRLAAPAEGATVPPTEDAIMFEMEMPADLPVNTRFPQAAATPPAPAPGQTGAQAAEPADPQDVSATRGYTYRQIGPLVDAATARIKHAEQIGRPVSDLIRD